MRLIASIGAFCESLLVWMEAAPWRLAQPIESPRAIRHRPSGTVLNPWTLPIAYWAGRAIVTGWSYLSRVSVQTAGFSLSGVFGSVSTSLSRL